MPRLFTYGTLMPGERNHPVLAPLGGRWRPARIAGRLLWKHAGTSRAYPGIVLGGGGRVPGMILEADALEAAWPELDAFEGPEYSRRLALCDAEGEALAAHLYVLVDPARFPK